MTDKSKIYIYTVQPNLLSEAILYLSKRSFDIVTFDSLPNLIKSTKTAKPVCILLSSEKLDNLDTLPEKISSYLGVPVVGYTEQYSMSSIMKLNQMGVEYKIRPPVSGAASYRIIQKALSDQKELT